MKAEQVKEIQRQLRQVGWDIRVDGRLGARTREAIRDFKMGYAFRNPPLIRNDSPGLGFRIALKRSVRLGGKCSEHFRFKEFASKGNGWIKIHFKLVRGLEKYRAKVGSVSIVSGYRDPEHNRAVGGVPNSQHIYGTASDIPAKVEAPAMKSLGVFSGIGIVRATGKVVHVDVRHAGPNNTTGGTTKNPTIWFYG